MTDSNVDVEGELNIGYTSYWNPEEHGHMSKTIDGTTEDDLHSEETVTIPKEVDLDNLTETRERVIREAAKNPKLTTTQLQDKADVSNGYASKVLSEECPNWYDNVFKEQGNSYSARTTTKSKEATGQDTDEDETETTNDVESACRAIVACSENQELVAFAEWVLSQ